MKITYCTNCGEKIKETDIFCPNCGKKNDSTKVEKDNVEIDLSDISSINKNLKTKNSQTKIVRNAWIAAGIFFILMLAPFFENNPLEGFWALAMISLFFLLLSLVIVYVFKGRSKKMESLINGENLIARWKLSDSEKEAFINYNYQLEKNKNRGILIIISVFMIVIFGLFIVFMEDGKLFMFLMLLGYLVFISFFALFMPFYYKLQHKKGDGKILLGSKFAYINGYFHNWDYPLSGLKKVKAIKKPFYGIKLVYYYTDRTLTNSEELTIPVSKEIDVNEIIKMLKLKNN